MLTAFLILNDEINYFNFLYLKVNLYSPISTADVSTGTVPPKSKTPPPTNKGRKRKSNPAVSDRSSDGIT